MRTLITAATFLFVATSAAAIADTVAFVGPASWSKSPQTDSPSPTRDVQQWHMSGDIATVTFVKDSATTYADSLGAIQKNITTNNIRTSADKDLPCRGATGHVFEFAYGPDGHRVVVNRLMVPDGAGVDTVTYARGEGTPFDSDVKNAETAFCTPAS